MFSSNSLHYVAGKGLGGHGLQPGTFIKLCPARVGQQLAGGAGVVGQRPLLAQVLGLRRVAFSTTGWALFFLFSLLLRGYHFWVAAPCLSLLFSACPVGMGCSLGVFSHCALPVVITDREKYRCILRPGAASHRPRASQDPGAAEAGGDIPPGHLLLPLLERSQLEPVTQDLRLAGCERCNDCSAPGQPGPRSGTFTARQATRLVASYLGVLLGRRLSVGEAVVAEGWQENRDPSVRAVTPGQEGA